MTALITQKTLAQSGLETVSLLYLLGQIGQPHCLVLVRRSSDRVLEAADYSLDMADALTSELDNPKIWDDLDPSIPTKKLRVKHAASSDGDVMIALIQEAVVLRRSPNGDWRVEQADTQPSTQTVNHVDTLDSNTGSAASAAIIPTPIYPGAAIIW